MKDLFSSSLRRPRTAFTAFSDPCCLPRLLRPFIGHTRQPARRSLVIFPAGAGTDARGEAHLLVGLVVIAQQLRVDQLLPDGVTVGAGGNVATRGDVVIAEAAADLVTELVVPLARHVRPFPRSLCVHTPHVVGALETAQLRPRASSRVREDDVLAIAARVAHERPVALVQYLYEAADQRPRRRR
eukprot:scaffold10799_cov48-Phaeocystis_antarctica.AAC.2